jgi:hypothetical protein
MEDIFLTPCPECGRHILTDEHRCPFCSANVRARLKSAKAPAPIPARRMGRASAFLFRATALAGLSASTTSACAVEGDLAAQEGKLHPMPDAVDRVAVNDGAVGDEADPSHPDVVGAADAYDDVPKRDSGPDVDKQDVVMAGDAYGVAPDVVMAGDAYGVAPDAGNASDATSED